MSREKINKFSGINAYAHPSDLDNSEFPVFENFEMGAFGGATKPTKRLGYARYSSHQVGDASKVLNTLFEAGFSAGDKLLINKEDGASSQLYEVVSPYTADPTAIVGASGSAFDNRLSMAMLKDKVYIANRGNGIYVNNVYNGTAASGYSDMGCPPCNNGGITGAAAAGGALSAGNYRHLVTFLYDGFQESFAVGYYAYTGGASTSFGAPVTTATLNDKITLSGIPTGNTRVTARKVYRTKAGTPGIYYLVDTINNNTDTTFVDTVADNYLGNEIDGELLTGVFNKPYMSKYLTTHKDRLWEANCKDDFFAAIPTADITLAEAAGGALDIGGVYKYRFYKVWNVHKEHPDGFTDLVFSNYVEKTITLTGANQSVDISYTGSDAWVGTIAYERTSGGGSDFMFVNNRSRFGFVKTATVNDALADTSRGWTNGKSTFTETNLTYPSHVAFSDASKPDMFPSGNVIKIGENDGEEITGIFSEEDAIIVFKENSIHKIITHYQKTNFWRVTPVVSNIGSDSFAQVQIADGHYVFVKKSSAGNGKLTVYEWTGGAPRPCSLKIQSYIDTGRLVTVRGITYDKHSRQVIILFANSATQNDTVLIYDLKERDEMNFGKWYIHVNATTNLDLRSVCSTKDYGVLFGNGIGYLYNRTGYTDALGATPTTTAFTSKIRTKTFDYGGNLRPRRFIGRMEVISGTVTSKSVTLKFKTDDITEGSETLNFVDSKNHQLLINTIFTDSDSNKAPRKNVYFELQDATDLGTRIISMALDIDVEHEEQPA